MDHHILQWASGRALIHMDTFESAPARTGVTRLSGAGYIGERRRPPPPLAFLTPEQEALFDKTNTQVPPLLTNYSPGFSSLLQVLWFLVKDMLCIWIRCFVVCLHSLLPLFCSIQLACVR